MALIRISELTKHFVNGADCVSALHGLDLAIEEGTFLGVMGPSGSGKSTLLGLLGGLTRPSAGKVEIDGIDLYRLSNEKRADFRREYLGFVFQSHNLVPYLTALENVMLPLAVSRLKDAEKKRFAAEVLERVGLKDRLLHLPQQLSGGEQERVAIARALVNKPPLILADEPTGSLDSATSRQVMELFSELHREGQTIVMVTHNRDNLDWFDRTIFLRDGQIVEEINQRPETPARECA
ncbi:ABC transporter ATP-binding protein [Geothermobacter hydrogeniphilus]|uniref:ABC transporter ATP-binding protein n=1 Tax=Geothermobacter hydrogeniphilus TaxID=1969733 RepID=A0A1X0Y5S5_9BACT|nr:ABC transporter ATP-binding protein [Geothermobacter hydrogeniphilus]ORJ60496.1 ABC transporter ATP-binding protein [Geothermobacter hydrogeniphilus]